MSRSALFSIFSALLATVVFATDADTSWQSITELDGGPKTKARTQTEARQIAVSHMAAQERALRTFLSEHGADPRSFEARLRLSRLLQIRADFEKSDKLRAEAKQWLDAAEKSANAEQRVEADFARVTFMMRAQRAVGAINSEQLVAAARRFQSAHPDDRRLAALLVEVATLLDSQPRTKRTLLSDARALTNDEELKARISDDLKRLDLLGGNLSLSFTSAQGDPVDIARLRGKAVVIVFFAEWSPPSTAAMERVKQAVSKYSPEQISVLGISLDKAPEAALQVLREQGVNWPTSCDGKGWLSPTVREFGVNALPTVWLVDQQGRLRSLNAVHTLTSQLRQVVGPGR